MNTPHPVNTGNRLAAMTPTSPVIRTPDQRVRIFISSTLDELAPERQAAREAIAQLHLTPVFFEAGARPYPPRELYRAYLAQSDIFLGLYWQRYGWVAPSMQISGLEDEYRLSEGKPRLIYVKTPAPEREPGLQALLDRIRSEDVTSYKKFATPAELRELLANDLALLLTDRFTQTHETASPMQFAPLPVPRGPLIDRVQECATIKNLLLREEVGLVTLTGPGGVGKTRLAVQVAAEVAPQLSDGVAFVSLAALTEADLVVPTIAQALRLSGPAGQSAAESLVEYLSDRHLLLVLDNFERLLAAAAQVAQILELTPGLTVLATSREPLRVRDEQVEPILPLALPDPAPLPEPEHLVQIPAVALFVARAREARPDFALTSENAAPIVEICQRLDGLPLALELAAAVLPLLPPAALLARLERQLPLPNRGARDLPERQQTLHNTIAWSYDLLQTGGQQLFRRLAVFAGGFTLEAVQAVCVFDAENPSSSRQADEGVVLEQVGQILDKSLVQAQQGTSAGPRFSMLETIREYASEQLAESSEEAAMQERHAQYFLRLAEEAKPHLDRPAERDSWLEQLEAEDANLRVALAWCEARQDRVEIGLRLAGALAFSWVLRGSLHEGRAFLEAMLAHSDSLDRSAARSRALSGGGMLAFFEGDFAAAAAYEEEALSIAREVGDKRLLSSPSPGLMLGLVRLRQGNIEAARSLLEESHSLCKELGNATGEMMSLFALGITAHHSGDLVTARAQLEESMRLSQEHGDVLHAALVLSALQGMASIQGDQQLARSLYQQALPLMQQAHDRGALGLFLINHGDLFQQYGEEHMAKASYREGLRLWQEMRQGEQRLGIVKGLAGLAELAAAQGQAERAGRLFGAADRLLPAASKYRDDVNIRVAQARANLDAAAFEAGWAAGQVMTEKQAIIDALQDA